MDKPKSIMMWRASEKLAHILSEEYLLGGSNNASLWSLGDKEFDKECSNLDPGTLVLLFRQEDSFYYVVGGAYFLRWKYLSVRDAWDLYGVHNGAYNFDDFVNDIKQRGGNEDSTLSMAQLSHTFIFDTGDVIKLPHELDQYISERHQFTLPLSEPCGRYLKYRVLEIRDNYISNDGADWHGMYYAASHRNSKTYVAEFQARVLNAYDFRCAISGVRAVPVLAVAHIQPFYDSKFQKSANGVVLRQDLYQLFKSGYITFIYTDRGQKLVAKVSSTVRTAYGEDYMAYDGKELILPADRNAWPDPRYVLWHKKNCFENWLKVGGVHS